jgi:hypothetical protein
MQPERTAAMDESGIEQQQAGAALHTGIAATEQAEAVTTQLNDGLLAHARNPVSARRAARALIGATATRAMSS